MGGGEGGQLEQTKTNKGSAILSRPTFWMLLMKNEGFVFVVRSLNRSQDPHIHVDGEIWKNI